MSTFTHAPRPGQRSTIHPRMVGFGDSDLPAVEGVINSTLVRVARWDWQGTAELRLDTALLEGSHFSARVDLPPAALRELASRLIDAAHDIEQQGGGGA